ncbi:MAG: DUF748 domain-containing protein [Zoogloeaceae bacterium]|jgi:uncharacterized protein involved in outer membrane biogenesis|nr:DUF748 domain-containing protein [Zoogloeaceae bacterium]
MSTSVRRRWPRILCISLVVILLVLVVVFQIAVRVLKNEIAAALGPKGEVQELNVGLTGVEIIGIRLPAEKMGNKGGDWPVEDLLRAERIVVVPSLIDLLSARVVLKSIRIEGAYLSMLRSRDGRLRVVPSLTETAAPASSEEDSDAGAAISIGHIELVNSAVEFFDATVRKPALKIRLEQLNVSLDNLHLPDLSGESALRVEGVIKGAHQDGKINIAGKIELASKESDLETRLRGVDLTVLQAYLIKAADTSVRRGSLDLDLHSVVNKGRLNGPGTLTLNHLELGSGSNMFMGVPRNLVVALLKNNKDQISIKFVLAGNINDPSFSLNENFMTNLSASLAASLGISLEGLVKGVGNVGSNVAKGVGSSLGKIFGK